MNRSLMRRTGTLLVIGLWLLAMPLDRAVGVLEIVITEGASDARPIAVVPFAQRDPGDGVEIAEVVRNDLARSGRFSPVLPESLPATPSRPEAVDFNQWRELGVDYLVVGDVRPGNGEARVRFHLIDPYAERALLSLGFRVVDTGLRRAAHHIADLIYEIIIGEPGVFSTRIAYITVEAQGSDQPRYRLRVADNDGFGATTVLESAQPLLSPSWSPDGRRLAYVSFESRRSAIYSQDIYSAERRRLTSFAGINGAPAWSPDGRSLALTLSRDGNPEIYVLEVETGNLRRLTRNRAIDTEPEWLPDGSGLVFTSDRSGSPQLYRLDLGSTASRRLTFEGDYNASPSVSPNGSKVALVHRVDGAYQIAVLELDTRYLTLIGDGPLDESPSFAPNGQMVLYAATDPGSGRAVLYAATVDGQTKQRLQATTGAVREPAWSPAQPARGIVEQRGLE